MVSLKALSSGPYCFFMYFAQLGKVLEGNGVGRQLFADDSGLYERFHPDQASADIGVRNMEDCCQEVKTWMSSNKLKLYDEKTEAILCGSQTLREKVSVDAVCVGNQKSNTLQLFEI